MQIFNYQSRSEQVNAKTDQVDSVVIHSRRQHDLKPSLVEKTSEGSLIVRYSEQFSDHLL